MQQLVVITEAGCFRGGPAVMGLCWRGVNSWRFTTAAQGQPNPAQRHATGVYETPAAARRAKEPMIMTPITAFRLNKRQVTQT